MGLKGNNTKQKILDESSNLFSIFGFKNVTMQQICDKTGLSRGGLYRHYGSTGEIFEALMEDLGSNQEEDFYSQMEEGIPAKIIMNNVLERMEKEMNEESTSLNYAIIEYTKECNNRYLKKGNERATTYWRNLIEYGVNRGEFACANIGEVVDMILYSYQGVQMYSQLMELNNNVARNIINSIKRMVYIDYEG